MKHLNKTNIRKALRKSWDDSDYHEVGDDWLARVERGSINEPRMRLWNITTGDEVRTGWMYECTSMTEYLDWGTELLCEKVGLNDAWRSKVAFQNACEVIWCGGSRKQWNDCGCKNPDEVWAEAYEFMAKE